MLFIIFIHFYCLATFFNLLGSNKLIEDNKAILWLSGWINCDEITGIVDEGSGGGGGGGVAIKDDEFPATKSK